MLQVVFKKDFRCFKKDEKLELPTPACILVGDQGAGKSSLLHALRNGVKDGIADVFCHGTPSQLRWFDTEKMNPRVQKEITEGHAYLQVGSHFVSHGQIMLPIMMPKDLLEGPPITLMVDEPESGLSLISQNKVLKWYRELVAKGSNVVLATHSPVLMKLHTEVYDVANRKLCKTSEYLEDILKE